MISGGLSIDGVISLMKRFNLNIGREKYLEQDQLAREYSTFTDMLD
jgi:hypothetical protein